MTVILSFYSLAPFASFEAELKVKFPITLESNHAADKDQYTVSIIKQSIKGRKFNFSYKERDNKMLSNDLGYTILEI